MTYKQKHKKNKKLIAMYLDALENELLTMEQKLKLATEIGRLNLQNKMIDKLHVEEYNNDSGDITIRVNSKINGENKNRYDLNAATSRKWDIYISNTASA